MSDIRDMLCQLDDRNLDASMFPLIRKWDVPAKAIQILEVLDHCIHGSLASGFIVKTLQVLYDIALKNENVTHEQLVPLATWRNE